MGKRESVCCVCVWQIWYVRGQGFPHNTVWYHYLFPSFFLCQPCIPFQSRQREGTETESERLKEKKRNQGRQRGQSLWISAWVNASLCQCSRTKETMEDTREDAKEKSSRDLHGGKKRKCWILWIQMTEHYRRSEISGFPLDESSRASRGYDGKIKFEFSYK